MKESEEVNGTDVKRGQQLTFYRAQFVIVEAKIVQFETHNAVVVIKDAHFAFLVACVIWWCFERAMEKSCNSMERKTKN